MGVKKSENFDATCLTSVFKNVLATEGGKHFLKKASNFWKKKVLSARPADMEGQRYTKCTPTKGHEQEMLVFPMEFGSF